MSTSVSAKYLGHSCILFNFEGTEVMLDPFIRYNPLASAIGIPELHPAYIFLSHAHEDHFADLQTVQQQSGATVAAIYETAALLRRAGLVSEDKLIDFNFGGTLQLPFGKAKMVYALHSNSTPDGQYAGCPCGFVFTVGAKKIYFAGDTALTLEMQLLADQQLDWAFLPIGGHYTMDVEDAIKAAQFINCKNIIGIHYDTFPPIAIDQAEAIAAFAAAGLNLHLPEIGASLAL